MCAVCRELCLYEHQKASTITITNSTVYSQHAYISFTSKACTILILELEITNENGFITG